MGASMLSPPVCVLAANVRFRPRRRDALDLPKSRQYDTVVSSEACACAPSVVASLSCLRPRRDRVARAGTHRPRPGPFRRRLQPRWRLRLVRLRAPVARHEFFHAYRTAPAVRPKAAITEPGIPPKTWVRRHTEYSRRPDVSLRDSRLRVPLRDKPRQARRRFQRLAYVGEWWRMGMRASLSPARSHLGRHDENASTLHPRAPSPGRTAASAYPPMLGCASKCADRRPSSAFRWMFVRASGRTCRSAGLQDREKRAWEYD